MSTFVIFLIIVATIAGSILWARRRWQEARSRAPALPLAELAAYRPVPAAPVTAVPEVWPFHAKTQVFGAPEQVLHFRLRNALPDHVVLGPVPLARFLGVKQGFSAQEWNHRIDRLSVDFLVCTRAARVVFAIEVDDPSDRNEERRAADLKKERALAAAGVRLVRVRALALPDEEAIAALARTPEEGTRPG